MRVWRQGDLYFARVTDVPDSAVLRRGTVLVHSARTGHSHEVFGVGRVRVLESATVGDLFIAADGVVVILHEEHRALVLDAGVYRVWRQRQHWPSRARDWAPHDD